MLLLSAVVFLSSWCFAWFDGNPLQWSQQCLTGSFDPGNEHGKLKKWEMSVTPAGFFRLRKYFTGGKQEYFSFNLKRLQGMDYLGTSSSGLLILSTGSKDIIVQTYNDPAGNIDSMSNILKLPVKNMEAERLDSLQKALIGLREH